MTQTQNSDPARRARILERFQYTLSDAAAGAGANPETISTHTTQSFIAASVPRPGSGYPRLYSLTDVYKIAVINWLARIGMPVKKSSEAGSWIGAIFNKDSDVSRSTVKFLVTYLDKGDFLDIKILSRSRLDLTKDMEVGSFVNLRLLFDQVDSRLVEVLRGKGVDL